VSVCVSVCLSACVSDCVCVRVSVRHGKYVYAVGSTRVLDESVKPVSDDDDWLIGTLTSTTTPMHVELEHVTH